MTGVFHDTRADSFNYNCATLSTPIYAKFCVEILGKLRGDRGFHGDNLDGVHPEKPQNNEFSHFSFAENLTRLRHK